MNFDFSIGSVLAALLFGVIGFVLLRDGLKVGNKTWTWIGIAMMVYPVFVSKVWVNWAIGLALSGWAYSQRHEKG